MNGLDILQIMFNKDAVKSESNESYIYELGVEKFRIQKQVVHFLNGLIFHKTGGEMQVFNPKFSSFIEKCEHFNTSL